LGLILIAAIQTVVATAGEYSKSFGDLTQKLLLKLEDSKIHIDVARISQQLQETLPYVATQTVGTATGLLSNGFLIVIFVIFLLAGRNPHVVQSGIYAEIESKARRYITTKFVLSATTGLLVWVILELFGLKMASLFGILAFLLNFIPSIGSVIATLLPIPVAVAQFVSSPWTILGVVVLPGAVQMIIGNVIEPKLMGQELQLHPVTILLSLAFWGLLWGPIGMVLAVPIMATIRIVLMRFVSTRPLGNLLAGELPGAPAAP
jgi:AI-2 transport protein TqsA